MKLKELYIKPQDWIYILFLGTLISLSLSIFIYIVVGLNWIDGLLFGTTLGVNIALISMVLISFSNYKILPNIPKNIWNFVAIIFSFLSGFIAFLFSIYLANIFSIPLIDIISREIYLFASIIGTITYLIGALMYRFVEMRNEKIRVESLLIESRLKSLHTQLNPHFLFNALNSTLSLMYIDLNLAEKMLLEISKFLRDTMKERDTISIEDELNMVERYIYIENIRFNNTIILNKKIDETTLLRTVPKFSIQLLVENAIKHGKVSSDREFEIDISIQYKENRVNILVSNSGYINEKIEFGIGLSNLQERLKYLTKGDLRFLGLKDGKVHFEIELGDSVENISS